MRRLALGMAMVVATAMAAVAGCAATGADEALEAGGALEAGRDAGVDAADSGRDSAVGPGSDGGSTVECHGGVDHVEDLTGSIASSAIVPGLALTPDEKTIYFGYDAPRGLVHAERDSRTAAFGPVTRPAVSTIERVTYPYLARDGHTIFVTIGDGSTSRVAHADLFAQTGYLAFETSSADVALATPFVDPATGALYVSRAESRQSIGTLEGGAFRPIASLHPAPVTLPVSAPVITDDGRRIYLALWTGINGPPRPISATATRPTTAMPWTSPTALGGLDDMTTIPGWVSPDGCRLYFTEKRPDAGWKARVATMKP